MINNELPSGGVSADKQSELTGVGTSYCSNEHHRNPSIGGASPWYRLDQAVVDTCASNKIADQTRGEGIPHWRQVLEGYRTQTRSQVRLKLAGYERNRAGAVFVR